MERRIGFRIKKNDELYHFGIKGMKWGVRRYQNEDGSLTPAGKKRYNNPFIKGDGTSFDRKGSKTNKNITKSGETKNVDTYFAKTSKNAAAKKIGRRAVVAGSVAHTIGQRMYDKYKDNSSLSQTRIVQGLGYASKVLDTIGNVTMAGASVKQHHDYKKYF